MEGEICKAIELVPGDFYIFLPRVRVVDPGHHRKARETVEKQRHGPVMISNDLRAACRRYVKPISRRRDWQARLLILSFHSDEGREGKKKKRPSSSSSSRWKAELIITARTCTEIDYNKTHAAISD